MRRSFLAVALASWVASAGFGIARPAGATTAATKVNGNVDGATLTVTANTNVGRRTTLDAQGGATLDGSAQGSLSYSFHATSVAGRISRGPVAATFTGTVGFATGTVSLAGTGSGFSASGSVVTITVHVVSGTGSFSGATGNLTIIGGLPASAGPATYTGSIKIPPPSLQPGPPLQFAHAQEDLVTVSPSGDPGQYPAGSPYAGGTALLSGDGRYVAFNSRATDLVPNDNNGLDDVFVRDMVTGITQRVSHNADGSEIEASQVDPDFGAALLNGFSRNGRFVTFYTTAQLLPADTNHGFDLYLFDRQTSTLQLVSASSTGTGSDTQQFHNASISNDGRYVAFTSDATDIVPGDTDPDPNPGQDVPPRWPDVFLRDMSAGTTRLVTSGDGEFGLTGQITPDGRYIAVVKGTIEYSPTTHQQIGGTQSGYVYNVASGAMTPAALSANGKLLQVGMFSISDDASRAAFVAYGTVVPGYTPPAGFAGAPQVYVRDLPSGTTVLADRNATGLSDDREPLNPTMSGDGRYVTFLCWCQRDYSGGTMGHEGIYRSDVSSGQVVEIDTNSSGTPADQDSVDFDGFSSVSTDGSQAVFVSMGDNLVPGDTNGHVDIFRTTVP